MPERKPPPHPGRWIDNAACVGKPLAWFFPRSCKPHRGEYANGLAVCETCVVRLPCLDYAIAHVDRRDPKGLYGGMIPTDRRAEKRRRGLEERTG